LHDALLEIRQRNGVYELQDSDLANHYRKILQNSENVIDLLDDFLLNNKGFCLNIKNFLFNNSFGDMEHYKAEIMVKYNTEEFNILTKDNNKLNW